MSEKRGTIESQTKTTRRLDEGFKQSAEREMTDDDKRLTSQKRAGKRPSPEQSPARPSERKLSKKALARWEGEGGAALSKKKGGKK